MESLWACGHPTNSMKSSAKEQDYDSLIHSFRHFNASIMILKGVEVKTVQACLGHNDATTTLKIYAHSFRKAQAMAMDSVADCILGTDNTDGQKFR